MIVFLRVALHCVLSHALLVRCSDPLLQMVFDNEDSSTVMGTISELKETRTRMECIASCIEHKCSAVIMEVCPNRNSKCQLNSVYCQHVQISAASEITLVSGQELWSAGNYAVGRTKQNETTTKTAATTTQNYATTTTAATLNYEETTTKGNSATTLVTTSSHEEASTTITTATISSITTAETTTGATTTTTGTDNSNTVLVTNASGTAMTTTTTSENPDTTAAIGTLITSLSVLQSEETSSAADTMTTTNATMAAGTKTSSNGIIHDNSTNVATEQLTTTTDSRITIKMAALSTEDMSAAVHSTTSVAAMTTSSGSENKNVTSNVTGQLSEQSTATESFGTTPSSVTTQNEDTFISMDTETTPHEQATEMTTLPEITTTEDEINETGPLRTFESSHTSHAPTEVSSMQSEDTSAVAEISTLTVSMATETTTITAINASEGENLTNTTACPPLYENWWLDKCYRLDDTAIGVHQTALNVCINDTGTKNSHLLHGIDMTQEELDAINGRLTQGVYWVAVKCNTGNSKWQWQRPGQDGISLDDQDVLHWLNRMSPPEGVGQCGAYNTTSQSLQPEDCDTTLPYICQHVNGQD